MLQIIGKVFLGVCLSLLTLLMLSDMWQWFILPATGLKVPQYHIIYGIILIISFFSYKENTFGEMKFSELFCTHLSKILITWCFGWIVNSLFGN